MHLTEGSLLVGEGLQTTHREQIVKLPIGKGHRPHIALHERYIGHPLHLKAVGSHLEHLLGVVQRSDLSLGKLLVLVAGEDRSPHRHI